MKYRNKLYSNISFLSWTQIYFSLHNYGNLLDPIKCTNNARLSKVENAKHNMNSKHLCFARFMLLLRQWRFPHIYVHHSNNLTWKIWENLKIYKHVCVETAFPQLVYSARIHQSNNRKSNYSPATVPGLVSMCKGITEKFNM